MTSSIFSSSEQRTGIAPSPRGSRSQRWWRWLGPTAIIAVAVLLISLGGRTRVGPTAAMIGWLLIALLAIGAWICPARLAIATSIVVLTASSVIEWQTASWIDLLPGQLVRLVVTVGLVAWLCRLRDKLAVAERLARIDHLTGLPNRQALIEALEAELSRAKRFGRPFTLALLDCDGFKGINDRSGHLAGDEVLRRIGESLRRQTRPFDCAGRWGGDEFLLVLSEVSHLDAELLAERLRAAIRHDVERDYPMLAFSLGVVTFVDASPGWQDCVQKADEAMYAAKRLGRNETRFEVVE